MKALSETAAAFRERALRETERWTFAVTSWERAVAAAVLSLGVVPVERLEEERLGELGMKPKECHRNARLFVKENTELRAECVTGWWRQPRVLVLHSVVECDGRYICVTPSPYIAERHFDFIPDSAIQWRQVGGSKVAFRDGEQIGIGVRIWPDEDVDWLREIAARLKSDLDPVEALALPHPNDLKASRGKPDNSVRAG